ncbi:MAG: hypothetical protein WBA22_10080 [Candidatus Methanofastidiosia archaeon]
MNDPFLPGYEPASLVENSVYLEYVETEKIPIYDLGQEFEISRERRCKIFDLMETNKEGFILIRPNGISKNEEHLERYLTRLGYKNEQYAYLRITYKKSQLLEVFHSAEVERRGIRFDTGSSEIQFWTDTDLMEDEYYCACRRVEIGREKLKTRKNIEMEDIVRINIRVKSRESGKRYSPEFIIYKDHIVSPMSSHRGETWNYIRKLLSILEEARGEYVAKGISNEEGGENSAR